MVKMKYIKAYIKAGSTFPQKAKDTGKISRLNENRNIFWMFTIHQRRVQILPSSLLKQEEIYFLFFSEYTGNLLWYKNSENIYYNLFF